MYYGTNKRDAEINYDGKVDEKNMKNYLTTNPDVNAIFLCNLYQNHFI